MKVLATGRDERIAGRVDDELGELAAGNRRVPQVAREGWLVGGATGLIVAIEDAVVEASFDETIGEVAGGDISEILPAASGSVRGQAEAEDDQFGKLSAGSILPGVEVRGVQPADDAMVVEIADCGVEGVALECPRTGYPVWQ